MIYLKKFETTNQYNAYTADTTNFIKPNVSFIEETNIVDYNPVDPYNGHEYVEIGGLKWATMNVGATSITDGGLFFQWGDTSGYTASQVGSGEGQKYFGWKDYKYSNNDGTTFTKYNSTDGKTVLDLSDDAARANMGGLWRMPTTAEYVALGAVCSSAWTTTYEGSASGMLLTVTADTADNGKQLFFPAAGICSGGRIASVRDMGYYWSSSAISSDVQSAYTILFSRSYVYWQTTAFRFFGFSVRGVVE